MFTEIDMIICFVLGIISGLLITMVIGICVLIREGDKKEWATIIIFRMI